MKKSKILLIVVITTVLISPFSQFFLGYFFAGVVFLITQFTDFDDGFTSLVLSTLLSLLSILFFARARKPGTIIGSAFFSSFSFSLFFQFLSLELQTKFGYYFMPFIIGSIVSFIILFVVTVIFLDNVSNPSRST